MKLTETAFFDAQKFGKFNSLIRDYLSQNEKVRSFYQLFPNEGNLVRSAEIKINQYPHREIVYQVIKRQLSNLNLTESQTKNLEKFGSDNCVTVTTGHQLNLMTGPLYFFYKIIQTIRCCEFLNANHPELNFVPVFWMATEDHDFEEINHFYFKNQKFSWNRITNGAVGRLDLEGLDETLKDFEQILSDSQNGISLKSLIQNAYGNSKNLTEATRNLVQELFGKFGLLMIDGDDAELKSLMIPAFEEELIQQTSHKKVSETNVKLSSIDYPLQVHPREINLFYLADENSRDRIVQENGIYEVLNQNIQFNQEEIIRELHHHPERFSPNVILRPLYQETILPNIAYIGGSGEISYWLQLKSYFDSQNIPFPLLIVRNSLLIMDELQKLKLEKLDISYDDLLMPLAKLTDQNISKHSSLHINFEKYREQITNIFHEMNEQATKTDVTFSNMVNAQEKKQLNGLEKMEQRFRKAEKRKHHERVERIKNLVSDLFPGDGLQERKMNFSELWVKHCDKFIDEIYHEIQPYDFRFIIKTLP